MSNPSEQFSDEYDFIAVCLAALDRQDYKAALSSLRRGLNRNLEGGQPSDGREFARHMLTVVDALGSNLRKAYGYEWEQSVEIPEAVEGWRKSRCSFCGKSEEAVEKIIVGGAGSICNACVGICLQILRDAEGTRSGGVPA
jgi:hypothetical protein